MISIKRASLYILLVAIVCSSFTFFFLKNYLQQKSETDEINAEQQENCDYNIYRLSGYKFIKPLAFAEKNCESKNFAPIKATLTDAINNFKANNNLVEASVYIKDFTSGEWTSVNDNVTYNPGSLIKVPILMTYLRMEELRPGTLEQQFSFTAIDMKMPTQHFPTKEIQSGKNYSIKELLRSMIINSDNNATFVLNQHLDLPLFKKVFTDIGLPMPDEHSSTYPITARQYSQFFKVLFNAGYLTIANSEYATGLLSESEFNDGLLKGIPEKTSVAHKYGESGTDEMHELHDGGIIYIGNKPYLITVMTKGPDLKKLSEVIGEISKIVYQNMKNN